MFFLYARPDLAHTDSQAKEGANPPAPDQAWDGERSPGPKTKPMPSNPRIGFAKNETPESVGSELEGIKDNQQEEPTISGPQRRLSKFGEGVEQAIRDGVQFLKQVQRDDGSWDDINQQTKTGMTSLVTLALLATGESPDSPNIRKALDHLRQFHQVNLQSTYAIALQTMVFATVDPKRDLDQLVANVSWLESAQIRPGQRGQAGSWTYTDVPQGGDGSNTQYALLGLNAASEVDIPVNPEVWTHAREYWEKSQSRDGGWGYHSEDGISTSSMTCAGISDLIITSTRRSQGQEYLQEAAIHSCGRGAFNSKLERGINWMASNFRVGENFPMGQQWKYYYLYGLERAGRLAGVRFFGRNDWFRLGAEELIQNQNRLSGFWSGISENQLVATSFALMFLANGRKPVLINKLSHHPTSDSNNDPDDVRCLVDAVSRDWKATLTWQAVDAENATVPDLLTAPVTFLNGHQAPQLSRSARNNLRQYIEKGGFIFAEACCGSPSFDNAFRLLLKELFPEEEYKLEPLSADHPIWQARFKLAPGSHPFFGMKFGARIAVIYTPKDMSCLWNHAERSKVDPSVLKAITTGQNVIDYACGQKMPPDKLAEPGGFVPLSDAAWSKIIARSGQRTDPPK
jgi:hypothetical protein